MNATPRHCAVGLIAQAEPVTPAVNGKAVPGEMRDGYATLRRKWKSGDTIELNLPMPVRRVLCYENAHENRGRVALERGPIVYCIEGADHDGKVLNIALPDDAVLRSERRGDLLGGITVIRGKGKAMRGNENGRPVFEEVELTAIPYYAWCHRGANEMTVWMPRKAEDVPPPPLAAAFKASASHCWRNDTVSAMNDGMLPKSSSDHGIPRMTWWDHKGASEWVQYDFPKPTKVTAVEVYWFDDTGRGHCRVPQSWRLLYRDGGAWKPVKNPGGCYGVEKDRFNRTLFDAVHTDALRLEVRLRPGFSGGVLEWRVNPWRRRSGGKDS